MLAEVLCAASWKFVSEGILLYRLTPDMGAGQGEYPVSSSSLPRPQLELFFCGGGALTLQYADGSDVEIGREECVLLTDRPDLTSIVVREPPMGYLLAIDPDTCAAFGEVYRTLGYTTWNCRQVQAFLQRYNGVFQLKHGSWNQSVFSVLRSLPDAEQGSYCVLKAAELFYLLNTNQVLANNLAHPPAMSAYLVELLACIGTYIENHLDEKLTIPMLCHQFNLSPTTLKNKFREFYGQPIHNWILCRRIGRAAELLQSTDLTVLQIAQSVGYESVSQFNVVFRRNYGIAPSLYRKNVRF